MGDAQAKVGTRRDGRAPDGIAFLNSCPEVTGAVPSGIEIHGNPACPPVCPRGRGLMDTGFTSLRPAHPTPGVSPVTSPPTLQPATALPALAWEARACGDTLHSRQVWGFRAISAKKTRHLIFLKFIFK